MAYPASLDELTDGVPSDGAAPTTALDNATFPHDDHHRALATAVEAIEGELGTDPSGASATVAARLDALDTTAAAKVPASLVDAAGDLIYATAADTLARLPLGTAGKVLTVNSGATAPEWAAAAAGTDPFGSPSKTGLWCRSGGGYVDTRALTANIHYWWPWVIDRDITIDRLGLPLTTGGAGSTVSLAVYADDRSAGMPGARLLAATIPGDSSGEISAVVNQAIPAGRVWFAVCRTSTGSSPTMRTFRPPGGAFPVPFLAGQANSEISVYQNGDYGSFTAWADPFPSALYGVAGWELQVFSGMPGVMWRVAA